MGKSRRELNGLWRWLWAKGGSGERVRVYREWGLWVEVATLKCCRVTRVSPWERLSSGARTGLGGAQLTLLALGGELDCQVSSPRPHPSNQADSIALFQKISPLAKNLGQGGEGKASVG